VGNLAKGTKLKIDGTEVANLTNISGPGITRDTEDMTAHDTDGNYRKFKGALIDGGEFTVEGHLGSFDNSNDLYNLLDDDDSKAMTVEYPSGAEWSFDGIVTGFNCDAPFEGKLEFDATIKVDGKPTFQASTT